MGEKVLIENPELSDLGRRIAICAEKHGVDLEAGAARRAEINRWKGMKWRLQKLVRKIDSAKASIEEFKQTVLMIDIAGWKIEDLQKQEVIYDSTIQGSESKA